MPRNFVKPEKRIAARQQLEAMIRDRSMFGRRLLGERELAAELGVGRKTLRGALADLEAEGLLDRRQGAGTFVANGQANGRRRGAARLAVIVGGHVERGSRWSYQGEMVRGLLGLAPRLRAECEVLGLEVPGERERIWDARHMRGFSGYVTVAQAAPDLLSYLVGLGRGTVVLLDHTVRDMPVIGVVDGSFQGARAVTRHLVGLGHRRIAFLDCQGRDIFNPWKHGGYQAGLADRGVSYAAELVMTPELCGVDFDSRPQEDALRNFAAAALDRLLGLAEPPTALIGFDDLRSVAALAELTRRGRKVGEDFALAGMGDGAIRRGECDWLTSTRTYPRKMGRAGLRAALEGGMPSEGRTIIVPNRLYVRRSTCPPPAGKGAAS